jgi:hypothetical protein
VFDAKWSPDGTAICATDSHGHLHFIGHGSADRYDSLPTEVFFHTDYRPLLRDSYHNVLDEQTQLPPHLVKLIKSLLISTLDKAIYYNRTFLQGSTKPLFTAQNRLETS